MKNLVTRKIFVITAFILLGVFSLTLFAQDKKDEVKTKLEQLKGKIEKVTIKSDGKEISFEGKDAEKLGKILTTFGKTADLMWVSEDGEEFEGKDGNVMVYRFKDDKGDWTEKSDQKKKVEVKIENGNKKVTVTTIENGKENTKVYEGEEAEKFLKENEKEKHFNIQIKGDAGDKNVMFFKSYDDGDDCSCCCGHKKHKMKKSMHGKDVKKIIIEKSDKQDEQVGNK